MASDKKANSPATGEPVKVERSSRITTVAGAAAGVVEEIKDSESGEVIDQRHHVLHHGEYHRAKSEDDSASLAKSLENEDLAEASAADALNEADAISHPTSLPETNDAIPKPKPFKRI